MAGMKFVSHVSKPSFKILHIWYTIQRFQTFGLKSLLTQIFESVNEHGENSLNELSKILPNDTNSS